VTTPTEARESAGLSVVCLPPRATDAEASDRMARLYLILKRISERVDTERASLHAIRQEEPARV
jgi:hypothetical protein